MKETPLHHYINLIRNSFAKTWMNTKRISSDFDLCLHNFDIIIAEVIFSYLM